MTSKKSAYFLFCGLLGRLEDSDVSPRPEADKRHDEERNEGASAGVGAHKEVEVLRLGFPEEPRGSTVAEAPGREGGGDRGSRKSAKPSKVKRVTALRIIEAPTTSYMYASTDFG